MLRTLRYIFFAAVLACHFDGFAQLADPPIFIEVIPHYDEVYIENIPGCGPTTIDLSNYVTYRIYLCFEDTDDCLQAIFGEDPEGSSPFDCTSDALDFVIEAPCGTFQHPLSGPFATQNNFGFWPIFPSMEWDSYVTMGITGSSDGSGFTVLNWPCDQITLPIFEGDADCDLFDGGSFVMDSNALFNVDGVYPNVDGKLLVASITTCGEITGTFGTQSLDDCEPGQVDNIPPDEIEFEQVNPCTSFPTTNFTLDDANCFGDLNILTFEEGGFGFVNYQLHDPLTDAIIDTYDEIDASLVINDLLPGDYYISTIDSVGCRDTSAVFTISPIPDLLTITSEVVNQMLCFGDNDGSISTLCDGGITPYILTYTHDGGNPVSITCGTTLTDLICGEYIFNLSDDNGCIASDTSVINCPVELVLEVTSTDVLCYNQSDGTITGSVTGGTGDLTVTWTPQGNIPVETVGPGPISLNATGIDEGVYDIVVVDANLCEVSDQITIIQPAPFTADTNVTNVNCFGGTDGCIDWIIDGGTPVYVPVLTNMDSGAIIADPCAIPAGMYQLDITDLNGCPVSVDSIIVIEPTELTYLVSDSAVTCFGQSDGEIYITDITGGTSPYSYAISPNTGVETEGLNDVNYTSLPANTYSVTITDDHLCVETISGITIETPEELEINLIATDVTCYSANNGIIFIESTGGTGEVSLIPDNLVLPVSIENLPPTTYTYTIQDENGCTDEASIDIFEPSLMEAFVVSTQNVGCGGDCDGIAVYQALGGTPPYNWAVLNPIIDNDAGTLDPNPYELDGLCADTTYELVITDFRGCTDTINFAINEPDPILIDYLLTPPTCTGMFDGGMAVEVSGGTGTLTTLFEPEELEVVTIDTVTFTIPGLGEGEISITVFDESNCSEIIEIEIIPAIITDMVLSTFSSPESCWNEQDGTATVAVQNGNLPISYQWNDVMEQTTPTAVGLSPNLEYSVVVTDSIGCTLTTSVFVEPTIGCFFMANALTPNGDGVNDVWVVGGLEYFPSANIQVFNRWGQVVFESTGYQSPWEGTYKGEKLPVADYYFLIEYDSSKEPLMGTVTIKY
jgi:gliding motility-associated-like protein